MMWRPVVAFLVVAGLIAGGAYLLITTKPWATSPSSQLAEDQKREAEVAEIIKTNDPAQCESVKDLVINGTPYYTVCLNNVYTNLALEKSDPAYCEKLDNQMFSIESCKSTVMMQAVSTATSPAVCESMGSTELKSACVFQYWTQSAVKQGSVAVCNSMPDQKLIGPCRDSVLVDLMKQGKQIACTDLSPGLVGDCKTFYGAVIGAKSMNACSTIVDPMIQDVCASTLSQ